MPWPAPVMIATFPSSRMAITPPGRVARGARSRLAPVDEVERLRDHGLPLGVTPHGLHHDEGHDRPLRLLLVEVGHAPLAVEHVAGHDRAVVHELLLAVEDQP